MPSKKTNDTKGEDNVEERKSEQSIEDSDAHDELAAGDVDLMKIVAERATRDAGTPRDNGEESVACSINGVKATNDGGAGEGETEKLEPIPCSSKEEEMAITLADEKNFVQIPRHGKEEAAPATATTTTTTTNGLPRQEPDPNPPHLNHVVVPSDSHQIPGAYAFSTDLRDHSSSDHSDLEAHAVRNDPEETEIESMSTTNQNGSGLVVASLVPEMPPRSIAEAVPARAPREEASARRNCRRMVLLASVALALIFFLTFGLAVGSGSKSESGSEEGLNSTTSSPSTVPSYAPSLMDSVMDTLLQKLQDYTLQSLQDPTSPQWMAYSWLERHPNVTFLPEGSYKFLPWGVPQFQL